MITQFNLCGIRLIPENYMDVAYLEKLGLKKNGDIIVLERTHTLHVGSCSNKCFQVESSLFTLNRNEASRLLRILEKRER